MYGADIDAHDQVFRANDAPAGGAHADLVGSKTDWRIGNSDATIELAVERSGGLLYTLPSGTGEIQRVDG